MITYNLCIRKHADYTELHNAIGLMTTFSFKYLSMLHSCTAPANITSPKLGPNPKQIVHMLQAQTFYHSNHELLICFTFRCNSTHWYYGVMRVCYASQQFSISPFPSRKKSGNFVGWFFLLLVYYFHHFQKIFGKKSTKFPKRNLSLTHINQQFSFILPHYNRSVIDKSIGIVLYWKRAKNNGSFNLNNPFDSRHVHEVNKHHPNGVRP